MILIKDQYPEVSLLFHSTGLRVINLDAKNATIMVHKVKHAANMYHNSSSKISVKAGKLSYILFTILKVA